MDQLYLRLRLLEEMTMVPLLILLELASLITPRKRPLSIAGPAFSRISRPSSDRLWLSRLILPMLALRLLLQVGVLSLRRQAVVATLL